LKRLDSANELRHFNLDFVPPDLESVPSGLDFVPKDLDFLHPAGGPALFPVLAHGRLPAAPQIRVVDQPASSPSQSVEGMGADQ
jgi:hypothetical protein